MVKKITAKKETPKKTIINQDESCLPEDDVLMEAGECFIPVNYFQYFYIAGKDVTGAKEGDIVFELLFQNGKKTIVETANNHNRKSKTARIKRQYRKGVALMSGKGWGKQ